MEDFRLYSFYPKSETTSAATCALLRANTVGSGNEGLGSRLWNVGTQSSSLPLPERPGRGTEERGKSAWPLGSTQTKGS